MVKVREKGLKWRWIALVGLAVSCGAHSQEHKTIMTGQAAGGTSNAGKNLFVNGSFELGLGAEPFYPGWIAPEGAGEKRIAPLPQEVPPRPVLDNSVAHSGKQSLHFRAVPGTGRAVLAFQPQFLAEKEKTCFSLWVRASRPGVRFTFGICPEPNQGPVPFAPLINQEIGTEWGQMSRVLPLREGYTQIRAEMVGDGGAPFDVWIDDICWTVGEHNQWRPSGTVEAVLLPGSSTGMHFADQPVGLTWSAVTEREREVEMRLTVCDLTRADGTGGNRKEVWAQRVALTSEARQGVIPLPGIRRGAYQAELVVCDPATAEILGMARDRFTVMADLRKVPAPVGFACGMHYGLGFGDKGMCFNWRGYWSPDEFFAMCYQTGFRVQRMIWSWESAEPQEGSFRWEQTDLDRLNAAALRNGCATLPCIPRHPLTVAPKEYAAMEQSDFAGQGQWIVKKGRRIQDASVRSAIMGYSRDQTQRKLLFAPPPGALARFCREFALRYRGKIVALELMNESNLYINAQGLLDYYFKDAYPAVKSVAPEMPVLMNQTMDYAADGNGYTGQFLALGGAQFADGFTHHPYGCDTLESGGLEAVRILERLAKQYSRPDKPLILGMSEAHFLSNLFARGEVVQRALLDWSIGCRWSAGAILEESMFYEGGKREKFFRRGPFAPGVGAVQLNAMYAVLGGASFLRRIDLDDNTLLACFEHPAASGAPARYTAVLCAGRFPTRRAFLHADLSSIPLTVYDWCGEPMNLPQGERIALRPDALYLQSPDPRIFERLAGGSIVWGQRLTDLIEDPESARNNPAFDRSMLETNLPVWKQVRCDMIREWKVVSLPGKTATESELVEAGGILNPQVEKKARTVAGDQHYTALATDKSQEAMTHFAYAALDVDAEAIVPFRISANSEIRLWVNGREVLDQRKVQPQLLGREWSAIRLPLRAGLNHLLVRGVGAPCAFILAPEGSPLFPDAPAIDAEGFLRRWSMIGPWNNVRDAGGDFIGLSREWLNEKTLAVAGPDLQTQGVGKLVGRVRVPLVWREVSSVTPVVGHPWKDAISYAFAVVEAKTDLKGTAMLGSDDGYALWINGEEVGRKSISRGVKIDEEKHPVRLRKGRNTVLLKIEDSGGGGGFVLRFLGADGIPLPLTGASLLP